MVYNGWSGAVDDATALKAMQEGAVLLCLNTPTNTIFGVDMVTYSTGDFFRGIKMIPPGMHMVRWASYGGHHDVDRTHPQSCRLIILGRGEVRCGGTIAIPMILKT